MSINKLDGECVLIRKAISTESSTVLINIVDGHSGVASLSESNAANLSKNTKVKIVTMSGAELSLIVEHRNIPIVVKIDVEGHELEVIKELVNSSLIGRVSEVFYEIDESWSNSEEIVTILKSVGFSNFKKIGSGTHYDVLASRA